METFEFRFNGVSKTTSLPLESQNVSDMLCHFKKLFSEEPMSKLDHNFEFYVVDKHGMNKINDTFNLKNNCIIEVQTTINEDEKSVESENNENEVPGNIETLNSENDDRTINHLQNNNILIDDRKINHFSDFNCVNSDFQNTIISENTTKDKDRLNRTANEDNMLPILDDRENNTKNDNTVRQSTPPSFLSLGASRFVVRLRGLPWSAREQDIQGFFKEDKLKEIQIVFLTDGRASGEALVEFETMEDYQSALLKNRRHIGRRYIEIFKSTGSEIDTAAGRVTRPPVRLPQSQYVMRLRGLPYSATEEDVFHFFHPTKPTSLHLIKDDLGRPSGEGFVEFDNELDAVSAMAKHRQHMGHRYIELFRSSVEELTRVLGLANIGSSHHRSSSANRNNKNTINNNIDDNDENDNNSKNVNVSNDKNCGTNIAHDQHNKNRSDYLRSCCILMRGLPYTCTESDLTKFFQEADVVPVRIHRKADGAEAYVEFYSISDTDKAMTKHKNYIGRRYIELFRVSYEDMARIVGLPLNPIVDITNILNKSYNQPINNITSRSTNNLPTNLTNNIMSTSLKFGQFSFPNTNNRSATNLSHLQSLLSFGNDLSKPQISPNATINPSIYDLCATPTAIYNNDNNSHQAIAFNLFNNQSPSNNNYLQPALISNSFRFPINNTQNYSSRITMPQATAAKSLNNNARHHRYDNININSH